MEEQQYTVTIYEHSDRWGRFVGFEIDMTGKRSQWLPANAPRQTAQHRECIFSASRVANPVPDTWEKVYA